MRKNIWIFNHYASNMFKEEGGRHYWFSENLIDEGYNPVIFCANTYHNSKESVSIKKGKYIRISKNNIPFVFVKTIKYYNNGLDRIKNMISFYKNLFPTAKKYHKENKAPDIIIASSVHPLTLVAGIKLAKKFNVPCVCEVRDLWPESLVAYGSIKENSILAKLLYKGEKWIYKKADAIIMTWEGGKDYIVNNGWEKDVNLEKITHINNGVVVKSFDDNSQSNVFHDEDLENDNFKKVVYAGSIRKVNNIGMLLDAAKVLENKGYKNLKLIIFGTGDEESKLKERIKLEKINNVIFKGKVEKKYIPFILKKAHVNILHNSSTSLDQYGQSQNKFFEYMAAGKCIVQTYPTNYSICERYNCGVTASEQTSVAIADAIIQATNNEEKNSEMGKNAREAVQEYDFKKLTSQLINVIERV